MKMKMKTDKNLIASYLTDKVNCLIDIRRHFRGTYNFQINITINPTDMKDFLWSVVWECAACGGCIGFGFR